MRILLVEDDPVLGKLVETSLVEDGFCVDLATDGKTALFEAKVGSYDAVVLDVMLSDMDGFDLCSRLRAAEVWTPIIMATARTGVSDRVRGLDVGADDYLIKPFSLAELSARLRALIRRGQPERPAVLEAGRLRLDPASREIWRDAELLDVQLTPREFRLLELLMRNKGLVLSREQILDRLWGVDSDEVSNVVEQTVRYLRIKLDEPAWASNIETVRGFGYRIRA